LVGLAVSCTQVTTSFPKEDLAAHDLKQGDAVLIRRRGSHLEIVPIVMRPRLRPEVQDRSGSHRREVRPCPEEASCVIAYLEVEEVIAIHGQMIDLFAGEGWTEDRVLGLVRKWAVRKLSTTLRHSIRAFTVATSRLACAALAG